MGTNIDKKMPQKIKWDVLTKHKLTKIQKQILKDYFENGPCTRYELSKKKGKLIRGKSYNQNLDRLVYLRLLKPDEHLKEATNIKQFDSSMIENFDLRKAIRKANEKKDFSRPRNFTKKQWEWAQIQFRMANYNDRFRGKVGETVYSLSIWGIVVHLRNEQKIPPRIIDFFGNKQESKDETKPRISNEDLDFVIKHFERYFGLISRKWDYLCKNNEPDLVYEKLFQVLFLANYYFEIINAEFQIFEKSATDDLELSFFLPNLLVSKYAEKWMSVIVKDNEIYDYLSNCFKDLKENFKINQEIVVEYKTGLDSFRKGKKKNQSKFFKKTDFVAVSPGIRHGLFGRSSFLGKGYWGYPLSYFMNVLDCGIPLNYRTQQSTNFSWYRKKHGQTAKS